MTRVQARGAEVVGQARPGVSFEQGQDEAASSAQDAGDFHEPSQRLARRDEKRGQGVDEVAGRVAKRELAEVGLDAERVAKVSRPEHAEREIEPQGLASALDLTDEEARSAAQVEDALAGSGRAEREGRLDLDGLERRELRFVARRVAVVGGAEPAPSSPTAQWGLGLGGS